MAKPFWRGSAEAGIFLVAGLSTGSGEDIVLPQMAAAIY